MWIDIWEILVVVGFVFHVIGFSVPRLSESSSLHDRKLDSESRGTNKKTL